MCLVSPVMAGTLDKIPLSTVVIIQIVIGIASEITVDGIANDDSRNAGQAWP